MVDLLVLGFKNKEVFYMIKTMEVSEGIKKEGR